MLIRWNHYNSVITPMAVGITTADEESIAYVLVTGSSQQSSATSTLSSAGADMDQIEFITYSSDTGWIRDYGPRFIFEDGLRAMIDHTYNRPRPNDNAFPDFLSELWDEPEYDIPLTHGGGNFHLFSNSEAFMSDLILDENPGLTAEDVIGYYKDYQNLDLTIYPGFPFSIDGTSHIDMWMMPIGDYKIIIGQYEGSSGYPAKVITDNATADLESRGYTVYRIPGWNSGSGGYGGTHYTYTNATIFNDIVFISKFGGSYTAQDAEALAIYEDALPGYQIIQINSSSIIGAAGAMHCSMMHVPAYSTAMKVIGGSFEAEGPVGGPFSPDSVIYIVENATEAALDYEVTKTADWLSINNPTGTLHTGETVDVTVAINSAAESFGIGVYDDVVTFTNLTDHDGDTVRYVSLIVGVPAPIHVFNMDEDPGWSMNGQWDFGDPTGQGGEYGYADPDSGATGDNVCGVNLNGDYSTSVGGPYHLTTGALDCSNIEQTSLRFERWLNSDYQPYAYATLELSNNGSDWAMLWQNGGSEITENSWSEQVYDIASIADGQETVYIRWGYQVGSGAWAYSGWNLDDVEIWGLGGETPCPEDVTGDGVIDVLDLLAILSAWGQTDVAEDINQDGIVDVLDLLAVLSAWGPC